MAAGKISRNTCDTSSVAVTAITPDADAAVVTVNSLGPVTAAEATYSHVAPVTGYGMTAPSTSSEVRVIVHCCKEPAAMRKVQDGTQDVSTGHPPPASRSPSVQVQAHVPPSHSW